MQMRSFPGPVPCVAALVTLVACGPIPIFEEGDESTGQETSDGAADSSGTTTVATTTATSSPDEPEPGSDEDTGEPPSGFLENPDGGGATFECDVWTQNCPAGQKCMFWANDGGAAWNATRCSDIDPDPDEIGEPCTVEGNGASGIDSCEFGAMCWDVDPDTNEGKCIGMCTGSDSEPICEDPDTHCLGRGPFLCLPTCCPLEQDCEEGQACYPVSDDFQCAPDASGDMGSFGDPCEFINVCNPGLGCLNAELVPDCSGAIGCCSPFCEVGSSSCSLLHPDLECVPWYDDNFETPGLEHVGVCAVMG